jgi:transcription initiation protein SPT3
MKVDPKTVLAAAMAVNPKLAAEPKRKSLQAPRPIDGEPDPDGGLVVDEITFTDDIYQMMFVSGETAEPSMETTTLIEEIVRQQVVEMVSR